MIFLHSFVGTFPLSAFNNPCVILFDSFGWDTAIFHAFFARLEMVISLFVFRRSKYFEQYLLK